MPRTKVDDVMILALGRRRSELSEQIKQIEEAPTLLDDLRAELQAIELKLKEIDPTIPSKDEEAVSAVAIAGDIK